MPDVMKILLPPPDSFLGDVFAAFFARASAVVVVVVAAAVLKYRPEGSEPLAAARPPARRAVFVTSPRCFV